MNGENKNSTATVATPLIDTALLKAFIEGMVFIMKVQCQLQIGADKPFIRTPQQASDVDIAGLIGITSETFKGSIAICFPTKTYLKIMSKMLGEEIAEMNDELSDGAAELLNMIFGQAKKVLNEAGYAIAMALPQVVRAPQLKLDTGGVRTVVLPFLVGEDRFYMEIRTEKIRKA